MPKEIERKYLIDRDYPEVQALISGPGVEIRQGYIASGPTGVVRIRIAGDKGILTIKSKTVGVSRDEFEYEIPRNDAEAMLATMCGKIISKTRHCFPLEDGLMAEVDVFPQIDLVIAEVELPSADTTFTKPAWLTQDVSHDPAYFNNNIAERL